MKIVFSAHAKSDLLEIVRFISKDKPQAALNFADQIKNSVNKLAESPRVGRVVPEYSNESIRELIHGQYRIVYRIDRENNTIVFITVHHSKRLLF